MAARGSLYVYTTSWTFLAIGYSALLSFRPFSKVLASLLIGSARDVVMPGGVASETPFVLADFTIDLQILCLQSNLSRYGVFGDVTTFRTSFSFTVVLDVN